MGIFKKISTAKTAVSTPQTYRNNPFSFIDSYVPLSNPATRLYKELREAVPIIDAAIYKIIRLTGSFEVECQNPENTKTLNKFLNEINVSGNQQGISSFISTYFDQLLTYGTAIGEIVTDNEGNAVALYNASIEDIDLKRSKDGLSTVICVREFAKSRPVRFPQLTLISVLNPESGQICGNSIMKSLPFVSKILLKIYNTIGLNWERVGNVRFAVTYKPQNDVVDRAYAKDRAKQVAREWSEAMQSGNEVRDFVAVGDVSIKAIGADNQILDSEVPVRQMLEQIVAKTGLPPFMLGLSWSSTERMSSQQADVLTSELEAYRRILNPVIMKICNYYLISNGINDTVDIIWDNITLQDEVELAKARLYRAQSERIEQELKNNEQGF
ncbi:MAG: serine/threonine protein phosphatase [Ruminococcus sp.]|nr:serine/threonine protein phosphatase [Candidatus Copronaster equi]